MAKIADIHVNHPLDTAARTRAYDEVGGRKP